MSDKSFIYSIRVQELMQQMLDSGMEPLEISELCEDALDEVMIRNPHPLQIPIPKY